jgi:hypothetical protein
MLFERGIGFKFGQRVHRFGRLLALIVKSGHQVCKKVWPKPNTSEDLSLVMQVPYNTKKS